MSGFDATRINYVLHGGGCWKRDGTIFPSFLFNRLKIQVSFCVKQTIESTSSMLRRQILSGLTLEKLDLYHLLKPGIVHCQASLMMEV